MPRHSETDGTHMDSLATDFLATSRGLLTRHYVPKIRLSLEPLSESDIWWRPHDAFNSIGNLVLHLCGNAQQWIVSGVGGAPDTRHRPTEFEARGPIPTSELLTRLTATVREVDATVAALAPSALRERRRIQGRDATVFEAIYHVVEHFAMHTGQIILIAKLRAPGAIRFYDDAGGNAKPLWEEGRADIGR
jgi:uncharacterized damage-inducible protein DinB